MSGQGTAVDTLQSASASDLAAGLLGKLFDILTSGDAELFEERRHFFAWVAPGMPFLREEWDFMQSIVGPTPEDSARRSQAAWTFAQMVDFVPDTTGLHGHSTLLDARTGSLSAQYARALREAEVVLQPRDPEIDAKIQEIREALWTEEELSIGGVTERSVRPSFLLQEYEEARSDFEAALREEKHAQAQAEAAVSQEAITTWRNLGGLLRDRRISAFQRWESRGRKSFVENLKAEMARLEGEQMAAVVERLRAEIAPAALPTNINSGTPYFYAQVLPSTAIQADWSTYTFTANEYAHRQQKASSSASGGLLVPGLKGFATGDGEWENMEAQWDWTDFTVTFELTELQIERPWLDEGFLFNRRWRLPQGADALSDGDVEPSGTMPAIPDRIVLARNVSLRFRDASRAMEEAKRSIGGGGGFGFGPFTLGGKVKRESESVDVGFEERSEEIVSPAIQVVGYRCRLLPAVPDPDRSIPEEHWIGPGRVGGPGDD